MLPTITNPLFDWVLTHISLGSYFEFAHEVLAPFYETARCVNRCGFDYYVGELTSRKHVVNSRIEYVLT